MLGLDKCVSLPASLSSSPGTTRTSGSASERPRAVDERIPRQHTPRTCPPAHARAIVHRRGTRSAYTPAVHRWCGSRSLRLRPRRRSGAPMTSELAREFWDTRNNCTAASSPTSVSRFNEPKRSWSKAGVPKGKRRVFVHSLLTAGPHWYRYPVIVFLFDGECSAARPSDLGKN